MIFSSKYRLLTIGLALFAFSCGPTNPNVLTVYKNTTRDRDSGITFRSKNKLTLYTDSTYHQKYEHSDGECGLALNENGFYEIIGDTLILIPEVEVMNFENKYLIRNNRLYHLNYKGEDDWSFK